VGSKSVKLALEHGLWVWIGGKKLEEEESIKLLKHAYDIGINFFETDMYGKVKAKNIVKSI